MSDFFATLKEEVVLINEKDQEMGRMEKMQAHQNGGHLHRAISVLILNQKGEMLLQQRAATKYHCPLLRANTACSHPRPWESYETAAHRRLKEEMGFDCPLEEKFHFIYKADFSNGLTEWELDHVFVGQYDGEVVPNVEEVAEMKWMKLKDLELELREQGEKYAGWFKIIMEKRER